MSGAPDKLGKYELRGTLGRGAMGIVYDGWDPLIDRRVAIKTVRLTDADDEEMAEALVRFKREAQAAGRLTHPNIVGVYDYGEVNDIAFIVMEFASGKSLKQVLDEQKKLPPAEAVRVMEQVLAGLAYSHARGVVHRDIKPGNIIIVEGGQVKIADFGIARIESSSMTSVGTVMGTPAYMPPEQFLGEAVDARSDLYAAGVMAFQLLSGTRPYEGSMTTIMQKVLNTPQPPAVSSRGDVPASFDAVVARAMARVPADRYASADEFAAGLRAALAGAGAAPAGGAHDEDDDATVVVAKRPAAAVKAEQGTVSGTKSGGKAVAPPVKGGKAAPVAAAKKGSALPLIIGAVVVLAAAGGGAFVMTRGGAPGGASTPAATPKLTPAEGAGLTPAAPVGPQATTQTAGLTQPPPPPPLVQAKPAADPAVVGPAVASAAAAAGCSFLATTTGQDGVRVTGYVAGGDAQADINRAAQGLPVAWDAQAIDPYWCHTLDTLRPLASAGMMQVTLANASGALRDGDLIMPDVAGPDFPHWMVVDDFTQGGKTPDNTTIGPNVVHFYPTAAVRARRQAAGEMLQVRDKSWAVGPPFGTDLLIAVASSNPLFRAKRPAQEDFDAYLSALHMALDAAAKRGDKVAIGIGLLRTEAK